MALKVRDDLIIGSTKQYVHSVGLSACFRQWRAASHCHFLHGYALAVKLTFEANELDDNNWAVDFGGLKPIKQWLEELFDHQTCVAVDDPEMETFRLMHKRGLIQLNIVESVGCEAFAQMIFIGVESWLNTHYPSKAGRVRLVRVDVNEHDANGAFVRVKE